MLEKRQRRRNLKDSAVKWLIRAGGGAVVISLGLIFVYLFSEVAPVLRGTSIDNPQRFEAPAGGDASSERLMLERYSDIGARLTADGRIVFWKLDDQSVLKTQRIEGNPEAEITSFGSGEPRTRTHVYGFSDGSAVVLEDAYKLTFPN
ncbi:MAG: hypothetical protein RLN67_12745, partial [Algiphilus sp.]